MVLMLPTLAIVSSLVLADAKACVPDPAEVRVETKIDAPRIDRTKNGDQLRTMQLDGPLSSNRRFAEWSGLTVGGIAVDSEIRIANETLPDGAVCAWPSAVTITLSTSPTVYVVADRGTCQETIGLTHEMEHVAIDRRIIERYVPLFRRSIAAMATAIAADGSPPERDLRTQRRRIEAKINAMIGVVADRMNVDREAEQKAFDSVEEYTRLSNACPQVTVTNP